MITSLSAVDYQKLLQKIAVLETEVHHLRVNLGVNQQHRKQDSRTPDKKPAWSSLGAKPKDRTRLKKNAVYNIPTVISNRENNVQRLTGRTWTPDKTEWPPLPSRLSTSSTPLQQWKTIKSGRIKPPAQRMENLQLSNKFSPLLQIDSTSDVTPTMVRPNSSDDCLIVGDDAVKYIKGTAKRRVKVLSFPEDTVADMNDRISDIVAAHPTVKRLILHIGARDTEKQQSELLKDNFRALFQTLKSFNLEVCISAPLPPMRGSERFSRLYGLNEWLSTACREECFKFIDNFNEFYDRRHLFCPDGIHLNKFGLKLLLGNIFNSTRCPPHPKANNEIDKTEDKAGAIPSPPPASLPCLAKADVRACVRTCIAVPTTRDVTAGEPTAPPGGEEANSSNPANGGLEKITDLEDKPSEEKLEELKATASEAALKQRPTPAQPSGQELWPQLTISDGEEDTDGEEEGERTEHEVTAPPDGENDYSGHEVTVTTSPGGEELTEMAASPAGEDTEAAERSPNDSQEEGFQTPSPIDLLDFTPKMKDLINAGVKMTPAPLPPKPPTRLERHRDRRRQPEESPILQLRQERRCRLEESWQERHPTPTQLSWQPTWQERHQDRRRQLEESPIPQLSWQERRPTPTQLSWQEQRPTPTQLSWALQEQRPTPPPRRRRLEDLDLGTALYTNHLENTFDY